MDGTCEWIREDAAYNTWRSGDTNLLWINGGPGKGKTVLSIFLTQELERKIDTIFYFCSNDDQERNNATAVLRGLIWHVTGKRPQLADGLLEHLSDEKRTQAALTSPETLWSIFVKMLKDSRVGTKYCVLDGLDECNEDSQRWLVAKLMDLVSVDVLGSSNIAFKIAIISRSGLGLARCTQVRLDPDNDKQVGKEIQTFVSSRVQQLASMVSLPAELHHEVQTALLDRSEGTFLWVGFAMAELLKKKNGYQDTKGSLLPTKRSAGDIWSNVAPDRERTQADKPYDSAVGNTSFPASVFVGNRYGDWYADVTSHYSGTSNSRSDIDLRTTCQN